MAAGKGSKGNGNHNPYLWSDERDEFFPTSRVGRVARDLVQVSSPTAGVQVFVCVTNPGLRDGRMGGHSRPDTGVEPDSRDLRTAEAALCRRVLAEMGSHDTLREWTTREAKARGGNPALARDLLMAYDTPEREWGHQYKAMLRKVQEWRQGKYLRPSGANARRVAILRGNATAAAIERLRAQVLTLAVRGDWQISKDVQADSTKHTEREGAPSANHEAIEQYYNVVDVVIDALAEALPMDVVPELVKVYALYVDASANAEGGRSHG